MSNINASSDARERLAEAVERMADSQTFAAWLRARAAFHDYSFANVCLIVSQRPDASRVAGYKTWQRLGRQVRKGEHGIRILAPCRIKADATKETSETQNGYRLGGFPRGAAVRIRPTAGAALPGLGHRALWCEP